MLTFVERLADGQIIGQLNQLCNLLDDETAHPFDGVVFGPNGRPVSGGNAVVQTDCLRKIVCALVSEAAQKRSEDSRGPRGQ